MRMVSTGKSPDNWVNSWVLRGFPKIFSSRVINAGMPSTAISKINSLTRQAKDSTAASCSGLASVRSSKSSPARAFLMAM